MQPFINLDYESRSRIDLKALGLDLYSSDASTRMLMGAWTVGESDKMNHWDAMATRRIPAELKEALEDPQVIKWAFNAQFEQIMTERVLGIKTDPRSWRCTMALSFMLGFSGNLDQVGKLVQLPQDKQKLATGKALINMFCKPNKVTKDRPYDWRTEATHPDEWWDFISYNKQDVLTEKAVMRRLIKYPILDSEWELYALDQIINARGVKVSDEFARQALAMAAARKETIISQMKRVTGLANPNSTAQILPWLKDRGYEYDNVQADTVKKEIRREDADKEMVSVLKMRRASNRTSLSKYETIIKAAGPGGRFRFYLQFCGAARTGRWAGRRLQPQNLPRTPKLLEDVAMAAIANRYILDGDVDALELLVGEPMDAVVGLLRSALVASEGKKLVAADLSSIESVVIGWLTDCRWFMDTLAEGKDLYRSFAAEWLKIDYDDTKPHRSKAKPATLGAGYRLGGGDMVNGVKTGLWGYAENMGVFMTQEEAQSSVDAFRGLCPEIVQGWYDIEKAVHKCIRTRSTTKWRCLTFEWRKPFMCVVLPSGRRLYYFRPELVTRKMKGRDGKPYTKTQFQYEGKLDGTNKWGKIFSHGGKLIENFVQAIARDVIAEGLMSSSDDGFEVVLHVHDEIVAEQDADDTYHSATRLEYHMAKELPWAPGLPLGAVGWEGTFYRKG